MLAAVLGGCETAHRHDEQRDPSFTRQSLHDRRIAVMPPVAASGLPVGREGIDRLYDQMIEHRIRETQAVPWRKSLGWLDEAGLSDSYLEMVDLHEPHTYGELPVWPQIVRTMRDRKVDYILVPKLLQKRHWTETSTTESVTTHKKGKKEWETTDYRTEEDHYTFVRMRVSVFDTKTGRMVWSLDASDQTEREEFGFKWADDHRDDLRLAMVSAFNIPLPEGDPLGERRKRHALSGPLPEPLYHHDPAVAIAIDNLFLLMLNALPAQPAED